MCLIIVALLSVAPLSGLSDLLFIIRDALRTSHIRLPPAPAFFSNFFPFSCDLLKNKLSKSRACSVRALLLKNAAVPSLEILYRLSGLTKAVSDGEENTSRQPWHQRNPQKQTEPEICCERKKTWAFSPAGGAAALWKHYVYLVVYIWLKLFFLTRRMKLLWNMKKKHILKSWNK